MAVVKAPPRWLPPANSRWWHAHAVSDPLGRLRVVSLANPRWRRDTQWLARLLRIRRRQAPESLWPLFDAAITVLRRYPKTASGTTDTACAWDEVLTAWDELLAAQRDYQLQEIADAQHG
jgi:hypothetical protein